MPEIEKGSKLQKKQFHEILTYLTHGVLYVPIALFWFSFDFYHIGHMYAIQYQCVIKFKRDSRSFICFVFCPYYFLEIK